MAGDSSGMTPIGKMLHDLNEFIFVKHKKVTSAITVVLVIGLTILVFSSEARAKADEMLSKDGILRIIGGGGMGPSNINEILNRPIVQTSENYHGDLQEGSESPYEVANTEEKTLKTIEFTLTWNDETSPPGLPKIRNYENQPDTFKVTFIDPTGNSTYTGESSSGKISEYLTIEDEEIGAYLGRGNFTLTVYMQQAGDWVPARGPGFITYADGGNEFDLTIKLDHHSAS